VPPSTLTEYNARVVPAEGEPLLKLAAGVLLFLYSTGLMAQSSALRDVGEVAFVNSGALAAQSEFLRGLAQLHNFEYADAAVHFRRAEEIDPGFAMAYWGEAMTKNHGVWHEQELPAAREVLSRLGPTPEARAAKAPTGREKQYLATLEILYGDGTKNERDQKYETAMARLHQQYPDDVDATAFYALSILGSAEQGRDFATYMRAAAVLEEVFPQHPRHPGVVHYLIHCYDDPIHAPLGLRPARIYAQIAPDAGHAQHMTSHIFLALGMWDEVVKANEAAIAVVGQQRAAAGKTPHFCGHYPYWLEYGYMQQGRVSDARRILEGCREEAQGQPATVVTKSVTTADPDTSAIGSYAAMRANFLVDSELWKDDVAQWAMPAGDYPWAQLTLDYTAALAAYKTSNLVASREALVRMETDAKQATAWLDQRKLDEPAERNRSIMLLEQVRALLGSSSPQDTIGALQSVAAKEDALPLEFGPPDIYKPTDEILGELYLQLNRPADARKAFEADLARAPGRRLGVRGLAEADKKLASSQLPSESAKPANSGDHLHH
jgi:tetratricopeptide (TPR) repeat protein